jgi:hypothetical protein
MRIARTELSFSFISGSYFGTKQAQEQGLLGYTVKEWCTADAYYADGKRRTCDICRSLDGTRIEMDEDFYYEFKDKEGNKQLRRINPKLTGDTIARQPPAHPHCLCTIKYIEIEPPLQTVDNSQIIIDY